MRLWQVLFFIGVHFTASSQPVWNDGLDFHEIEERLRNESICEIIYMTHYLKKAGKVVRACGKIKCVTLESGLKAVFKPGEYRFAEVAAYKASKLLGLRLVPPTVLRTIDGVEGSLQFFVESSLDLLKWPNRDTYFNKLDPKDLSDMMIFYFVFGQWDLHAGNQMIVASKGRYFLALIDNAGMLHKQHVQYGDFPFIHKGDNDTFPSLDSADFPFEKVCTVKCSSFEQLNKLFAPYISQKQREKMWLRHKPITYVIWKGALWMQMYKHNSLIKPLKVSRYYAGTLEVLKKLDRNSLQEVWSEGRAKDQGYYDELIRLILVRRDQIFTDAAKKGKSPLVVTEQIPRCNFGLFVI